MTISSRAAEANARARPLKLGVLHVGDSSHGVARYGRILAAEAARRPSIELVESDLVLPRQGVAIRPIVAAARRLSRCDVVHVQFNVQRNGCVWGSGWRQLFHLTTFLLACRRPIVATIHDLYPIATAADLLRSTVALARAVAARVARGVRRPTAPPPRRIGAIVGEMRRSVGIPGVPLRLLAWRARASFVCSEAERASLVRVVDRRRVRVIPHFVEDRPPLPSRDDARNQLELEHVHVVTLLGYVHPRKGHLLAIDALGRLPRNFVLVFAGGAPPGGEPFVNRVLARARELQVDDRVRLTGYLSEEQLNLYLAATDVPICPFTTAAASGSMATWLSAMRPFLSSELPLVHEYNRVAGRVIATFSPRTPDALAEGILRCTSVEAPAAARMAALRQALSVASVFDTHVREYLDVLGITSVARQNVVAAGVLER